MSVDEKRRAGWRPPPDPVIEVYKKDVDRSLIRENLKLSPEERLRKMLRLAEQVERMRGAARRRDG